MIKINSLSTTKYKDDLPLNTINKIRNTLYNVGILPIEKSWQNSVDGFFSVHLVIKNTNLSSNGKGTTQEYALASAYSELMERLQNQAPFRLSTDLSKEDLEYKGFYYAPDEKHTSINEIINSSEDWFKEQWSYVNSHINKKELLKKWMLVSYEDIPSHFISLPYLNINNNKISYIPIKMVSKMYMSNGMCAGNTPQEALVQGISEILERYVNKKIVNEKITPPTIPNKYIKKYPKVSSMISKIKLSGNFDIILKDCSLNKRYPVVGAIFINKHTNTYFVKFGAHPIFEIAVERTLTELLQGQNIKRIIGSKQFSYKDNTENKDYNLMTILTTGSGYYPKALFSKTYSYEFNEFKNMANSNNKKMLLYLINLLKNDGYSIFIRDVSFLNFPSFHVIVPGLSEINKFDDINELEQYSKYNKIKKYIRNFFNISDNERKEAIQLINSNKYLKNCSIVQLLNLPTKNMFPWYYININLFIGAVYYENKSYEQAYKAFDKFINYLQSTPYRNNINITYYKCARDYIGTRIDNLDTKNTIEILSTFYPLHIINSVKVDFENPDKVLKRYGQLNCWDCKNCKLNSQCLYNELSKIYRSLKNKYASKKINQINFKKILSF